MRDVERERHGVRKKETHAVIERKSATPSVVRVRERHTESKSDTESERETHRVKERQSQREIDPLS